MSGRTAFGKGYAGGGPAFPAGVVERLGVDLTACWRRRVGMVTASVELTRELIAQRGARQLTLFSSREPVAGLDATDCQHRLSPHRHELANKLWLRGAEAAAGLDCMLYPYWPPALRHRQAPAAAFLVHDLAFRIRPEEVPWQQRAYLGSLLPPALRRAALVLTPSEATRRDLLQHYPLLGLEKRVHAIGLGGRPAGANPGRLPSGLEPGFLLAVGTVEPRKNYHGLLAAYRLLKTRGVKVPLVIAGGPGWGYGDLPQRLALEPGVHLLGHVDDAALQALYRNASVLAYPSLYEGFGLPLLEALEAGLPALVSNSGSLPEVAGEAALAVDPLQPEAIAEGLERMLLDADLRRRLSIAGRARAERFTWSGMAERTWRLLDSLS